MALERVQEGESGRIDFEQHAVEQALSGDGRRERTEVVEIGAVKLGRLQAMHEGLCLEKVETVGRLAVGQGRAESAVNEEEHGLIHQAKFYQPRRTGFLLL